MVWAVAVSWVGSLAGELPHDTGVAKKKKKEKRKKGRKVVPRIKKRY